MLSGQVSMPGSPQPINIQWSKIISEVMIGVFSYFGLPSTLCFISGPYQIKGVKAPFKRRTLLVPEPTTYLGRPKLLGSTVDSDGRTLHVPNLIRGEKKYHSYCLKKGNKLKKVKFTNPGNSCFYFSVICVLLWRVDKAKSLFDITLFFMSFLSFFAWSCKAVVFITPQLWHHYLRSQVKFCFLQVPVYKLELSQNIFF